VHVIAILQYVAGAVTLAFAALVAWAAVMVGTGTYQDVNSPFADDLISDRGAATAFGVIAGVMTLVALITIVLGRKIQRGRQWARVILLMLSVLSLLGVGLSIALAQRVDVSAGSLFYPVLCLILLNTGAARTWFRYRTW
jgi:hypothetical protein